MEAVPRLPMLSFDLKVSPESTSFGPKLKQVIDQIFWFIQSGGRRYPGFCELPVMVVTGYIFLSSIRRNVRVNEHQSRRDTYANMVCTLPDIRFEMVSILYNIGALHSQLGASDSRVTADGMKLSCTHFQCAAWAFQTETPFTPTLILKQGEYDEDDYDGQIMSGDRLGLKFPDICLMGEEKPHPGNLRDTYANMVCTLPDIRFEMVSILYNIGALHSQLGASDSRVTADGMKLSCTHFQCAAWAFQHLKDSFPQPAGVDLAPDVMQFMYHLSLAQAQECILEKSMMDNRKATIIAKVAVQIVDYYNLALNVLEQGGSDDCSVAETVGSKLYKNWKRYVKFKISYHSCVSLLYQGQQAEEQQKMGERVAYYQAASEKLEEAMKLSKGMDNIQAVNEALTFTMDVVEGKKKAAKNENEFIYHEEIPDKDSLPDVKGASLVKGIPFNVNDPEVSGPDIFARLVPMKAHEAASLYRLPQIEVTKEKEYQDIMGKRPPSIVATDLTREANKYQEAHAKASESNQTLHKAMTLHITKHIHIVVAHIDESSVKEMQHLLGKVEEMKRQRAMLATQLRESTCQDDITHLLVTHTGESQDSLFNQELQKHQRYVSLIEQNLTAQESILKALTDAYARYAGTRKATNEIMRKREATINALISSYDAYEDLLAKSSKGLEFYRKLETNVNKLLQRVKGTCKVQEEERDQILAKNNKTVSSKISNIEKTASDPEVSISSAPKLKDYLQSMKQGNTTGVSAYVSGSSSASVSQIPGAYYNTNLASYGQMPAPVASPQPSHYYDPSASTSYNSQAPADTITQQMVPAVRPAPVGSEGTSEQTAAVKYDSLDSEALKHQKQVYSYPNMSMQASTAGSKFSAYPTAATTYSSSTQYNYSDITSSYPMGSNTAYLYQQKDDHSYSLGPSAQRATTAYNPHMIQQYGSHENVTPGYSSGSALTSSSVPTSYPSDPTKSFTDKGINNKANQYSTGVPQQQMYQYPYNASYAANNSASYTNVEQKPQEAGSYYLPSSSGETYNAGVYTSTQLNYPPGVSYQTPAVTSSQPHQLPSSSGSYAPDVYQYNVGYQNTQNLNYSAQTQQYPQSNNMGELSTAATTVTTTSTTTIASSEPLYYGSVYQNTAVTSLPSNLPAEASVSTPQYYDQQYQQYQYPYTSATHQVPASTVNSNVLQSTTEFQYATPSNSSYYTSAGNCDTSQTCSSQTSIVGNTYAAQYDASHNIPNYSQVTSQTSYYSLPYGYQYNLEGAGPMPYQNAQNYQQDHNVANNQAQPNQMTYMQARGENNKTTTTNSQQGNNSLSSSSSQNVSINGTEEGNTSNVDLLAGLDFSLNQAPLVPQQPSRTTVAKKEQEQDKPSVAPVQQILSNLNTSSGVQETQPVTKSTESSSDAASVVSDTSSQSGSVTKENTTDASQEEAKTLKLLGKDPYTDPEALNQFVQEVGKYEKFVEGLTTKTLNGPTPLDMKWKELLELQEKDAHKRSISVARCYPMKNRFPDILPYDNSRIELPSTKDDYINASYVKNLTPVTPPFIITQAPLPSTYSDFWTMVWEQQVEVIVCLLNDTEIMGDHLFLQWGILTSRSTFEDKRSRGGKSHTRHPSEDFLLGPPTDLSQLQSGIEKMGLDLTSNSTEKQVEVRNSQTFSRKSSISSRRDSVSSISGSRSSSPGLHSLGLEFSQFSLSTDGHLDAFKKAGQGFSSVKARGSNLKAMNEKSDDPLSQLDPLWPLKRL
ncbi:hypothetical protein C0J52_12740 [Blattella germanica]|nr:hypothetical protein C0J52_12740 [Blattella germanica]